MVQGLFSPKINGGAVITAGTAAARATFAATGTAAINSGNALSVVNGGTAVVFLDIETTGTGTAVATTSHAILSGAPPLIIPIPQGTVYVQHVTSAGTATIYASRGNI